jgi:Fur family transcriptional regulator, ferric uptake regulator
MKDPSVMTRRKRPGSVTDKDTLYTRLDAYMGKKGLRNTEQRRVIAETFFDGPSHVTIEQLLGQVRARDSRIGYATVYRTLKLFTECGIAAERHFDDGPSRYELSDSSTNEHHDHFICVECGRIIEFHDEGIERLQEQIASGLGFRIHKHKHEIYGQCADCQEKPS